jgi:hypothetical protein
MKVVLETKILQQILSVASKLLEKYTAITLRTNKDNVVICISGPDYYFSADMPAKVEKKGRFSILPELLTSILKARANEIEFTVANSRLSFAASQTRLSGKDIALLGNEEIRDPVVAKKALVLPRKLQRRILVLLDTCALQSFYGKVLSETVFAKDGAITVVCVDAACAAIGVLHTTEKVNIPKTDLPAEYSERLKYIPGDNFSFAFDNDLMIIDTTSAHVELKMLQADKLATLEKTLELEKPKVLCSFAVDSTKLKQELDNLTITYEKSVPLAIELKNKTLQFAYKTSSGIFNNGLTVDDVKGQTAFKIDLEIFRNLLSKCSGNITIKVRDATIALHSEIEKSMEVRFIISKLFEEK